MRSASLAAAALTLALKGCACFEPVEEAGPSDAAVSQADAAVLPADAAVFPADAAAPAPDSSLTPLDATLAADASSPDGGAPAGDAGDSFCTGEAARVGRGAQQWTPIATTDELLFMDCCEGVDLTFHTAAAFGDLSRLMLTAGGNFPLTDVAIGPDPAQPINASLTIGGSYFGSGLSQAAGRIVGDIAFSREDQSSPLLARICLTLSLPGDRYDGARLFAPAARVMPWGWEKRFALYLLKDRNLDAAAAAKVALDSLVLDDPPLLDLYSISYYRGADNFVAFALDMSPERLKNQLGTVPVLGRPFVAVADGQRVYLGAFWTPVSSVMPTLPYVAVEQVNAQGFTIDLPAGLGDPRSDPRVLTALTDSGKLAP